MKRKRISKGRELQGEILSKLSRDVDLKFSQLSIKNVDSNLFTYHLKSLQKDNLVQKNGLKYNLTVEGKSYLESISGLTKIPRTQPTIASLIIIENNQNEFLFYNKGKHPFLGKNAFIYGKMHRGESVVESAKRELKEKTNLNTELKFKGNIYLRICDKEKINNHFLFNIFYGKENISGKIDENVYGNFTFSKLEDVKETLMPGMSEVLNAVRNNNTNLFEDITVKLN